MPRSLTLMRNFIAASLLMRLPKSYFAGCVNYELHLTATTGLITGGRESAQKLVPGLERLEIGQDGMTVFTLTSLTPNAHLTIRLKPSRSGKSVFGDIAVTYLIVPISKHSC